MSVNIQREITNYLTTSLSGENQSFWSSVEAKKLLRYIRDNNLKYPDLVIKYGNFVIKLPSFDVDIWVIVEQIFFAALEVNNPDLAKVMLLKLEKQFTSSLRVKKLSGIYFESKGKYDQAEEIYQNILEIDSTDTVVLKRRIAIKKAQGNYSEAISQLNLYLKDYMGDFESWQELGELYLIQNQYSNAAYCYEELIISSPENYHLYNRYAEILYTISGISNIVTARKYFALSLELCPEILGNTRALYGIIMCCNAFNNKSGKNGRTKDNTDIGQWAKEKLLLQYKKINTADKNIHFNVLNSTLSQLNL